jgi:sodium/bile acid cotransporter 7
VFDNDADDDDPNNANADANANAPAAAAAPEPKKLRVWTRVQAFVLKNFLPLSFGCALVVALSWPAPGAAVGAVKVLDGIGMVQAINNMIVFFISGVTLDTGNALAAVKQFRSLAVGLVAILLATPCLGFALRYIPFHPSDFTLGLTIFSAVPTTLGVGVALTVASKGNEALALLLTVSTNLVGIFTVPALLQAILATSGALRFNTATLVAKLCVTILVPSVLGAAVRRLSAVAAAWVKAHRTFLSLFSTCNLVCVIWQTLSTAAPILLKQDVGDIMTMVAASAIYHVVLLVAMYALTFYVIPLPVRDRVAVVIMSAQKSAPVAVTVISYITTDTSRQGLMATPGFIGQLAQIFIGAAVTKTFANVIKRETERNGSEHVVPEP